MGARVVEVRGDPRGILGEFVADDVVVNGEPDGLHGYVRGL